MEKDTQTTSLETERSRLRKELLRMIVRNELQRRGEAEPLPKTFSAESLQPVQS